MALLYPDGHPYGRPTKGAVDVVERLTRDRPAGAITARSSRPAELIGGHRRRRRRGPRASTAAERVVRRLAHAPAPLPLVLPPLGRAGAARSVSSSR